MATLKETAQGYEPPHVQNVADLEVVRVDAEIKEENAVEYPYKYIEIAGERFRVPNTVLTALKEILVEKPNLSTFKVSKQGEGLKTSYTVIPLN